MTSSPLHIAILDNLCASMLRFRGTLLDTLARQGHTITAIAPGATPEHHQWLQRRGIRYQAPPLDQTGQSPHRDIYTWLWYLKCFRSLQPDVVLSYTVKPIIYASQAARLTTHARIYSVITGLSPAYINSFHTKRPWVRRLQQKMYQQSLKHNHCVFFYNPDDLDVFQTDRILSPHTHTMILNGSGVSLDEYPVLPLPETAHFLMVSRLLQHKGTREYAHAAQQLKTRYPDAVFSLVGPHDTSHPDAIPAHELQSWIDEGSLQYHGKTDDVRSYWQDASVCVLPSYREGVPRAIQEAMAMGRGVITTDTPGCRRTVKEGYNGWLIPPRQTQPLVEAMERMIQNPNMRKEMGQNSRIFATETFDVNRVIQPLIETLLAI